MPARASATARWCSRLRRQESCLHGPGRGLWIVRQEGHRTQRHGEAADGDLCALARLVPATPLRAPPMDQAYFSALAALAGSAIGGMTSLATSWLSQRAQFREQELGHDLSRREDLYRDFNEAASRLYTDAW